MYNEYSLINVHEKSNISNRPTLGKEEMMDAQLHSLLVHHMELNPLATLGIKKIKIQIPAGGGHRDYDSSSELFDHAGNTMVLHVGNDLSFKGILSHLLEGDNRTWLFITIDDEIFSNYNLVREFNWSYINMWYLDNLDYNEGKPQQLKYLDSIKVHAVYLYLLGK